MSMFFRPIVGNPKLKELWGRCDVCFMSDPMPAFNFLRRGTDPEVVLCLDCSADDDVLVALHSDGWRFA